MKFNCTSGVAKGFSFFEALALGFAPDGSLFIPEALPIFSPNDLLEQKESSFQDLSLFLARRFLGQEIPLPLLRKICFEAFDFPLPIKQMDEETWALELFQGPTLSFKDIGARFMAACVKHLWQEERPLTVLVATTGDTGSAVASAFHRMPQACVKILYPKGRVTPSQEKQLTTFGENVEALEIQGTFDDCQRLLKAAVLDSDLRKTLAITTGNSINVARLIPQLFYFFYAYLQIKPTLPFHVSVPCGNFGHLVSALLAKRAGLPIERFIAGTNINDEIPLYLKSGIFLPHPSLQTIAVSMDVGNPSNADRLFFLFNQKVENMRKEIVGLSFTDEEIRETIRRVKKEKQLIIDPHSAISYAALNAYRDKVPHPLSGLFLETAHPAKFIDVMKPLVGDIEIPERLQQALKKKKKATPLKADFEAFKSHLLRSN